MLAFSYLYEITRPFIGTCQCLNEPDISHLMEAHRDKYISVHEDPEEIYNQATDLFFMWHKKCLQMHIFAYNNSAMPV